MMPRNGRDQRSPSSGTSIFRQSERDGINIVEPHPASAVIKKTRQANRLIVEALRKVLGLLCLEFLRKLADVVQTEQKAHQANSIVLRQFQLARDRLAQPAIVLQ